MWRTCVQEEPHASRKTAILAKHPEIKELMRPEPLTKWVVFGTVALQVISPIVVSRSGVAASGTLLECVAVEAPAIIV